MNITAIGERIREERLRVGLTQTAFGECGGIALRAQQHYEMGRRAPDAAYLAQIAARGGDVLYVLTGVRLPEIWRDQVARVLRTSAEVEPEGGRLTELALLGIGDMVAEAAPAYGDLSADERQLLALFRRADLSTKMRAVAVLNSVSDMDITGKTGNKLPEKLSTTKKNQRVSSKTGG